MKIKSCKKCKFQKASAMLKNWVQCIKMKCQLRANSLCEKFEKK